MVIQSEVLLPFPKHLHRAGAAGEVMQGFQNKHVSNLLKEAYAVYQVKSCCSCSWATPVALSFKSSAL